MIPKEIDVHGVFLPPMLIVIAIAIGATLLTARLLNYYRLTRFFAMPRLVFVSFILLYVVFFGTFLIRI